MEAYLTFQQGHKYFFAVKHIVLVVTSFNFEKGSSITALM